MSGALQMASFSRETKKQVVRFAWEKSHQKMCSKVIQRVHTYIDVCTKQTQRGIFRSYEERRGVFVFGHLFIVVLGVMIHLYLVPAFKPVPNIGLACGDAKGKKVALGVFPFNEGIIMNGCAHKIK
jgi:hypothetical protein